MVHTAKLIKPHEKTYTLITRYKKKRKLTNAPELCLDEIDNLPNLLRQEHMAGVTGQRLLIPL